MYIDIYSTTKYQRNRCITKPIKTCVIHNGFLLTDLCQHPDTSHPKYPKTVGTDLPLWWNLTLGKGPILWASPFILKHHLVGNPVFIGGLQQEFWVGTVQQLWHRYACMASTLQIFKVLLLEISAPYHQCLCYHTSLSLIILAELNIPHQWAIFYMKKEYYDASS